MSSARTNWSNTYRFRVLLPLAGTLGLMLGACTSSGSPTSTTTVGPAGNISIATFNNNTQQTTPAFHIDVSEWLVEYSATSPSCLTASLQIEAFNSADPSAFVREVELTGCASNAILIKNGPGNFFLKLIPTSEIYSIQVVEVRK